MSGKRSFIPSKHTHGTVATYTIGFVLSLGLTLAAYVTVVNHALAKSTIVAIVVGLALTQLFVQLLFFLHLGREAKPRWRLIAFLFMLMVIGIVVLGSLWIMDNLNYHMMPHDADNYIMKDEGIR